MTTTTMTPAGGKPKFFVLFPTTATFIPESSGYVYFSLPAGKAFPSDLTKLMEKTERYISFKDSEIEGVETQTCEGADCTCTGCRQKYIACSGESCKGFVSSTDGIKCSNTACVPTNNIEYTMYALYPDFMNAYSPKFKFMRYIRGGSSTTTPMPSATSGGADHVLFSVGFPSMDVFDTTDKFKELQASITAFAPTLKGLDMYEKHNTATLQRIIKKNKLSRDVLDVSPKKPSSSATQKPNAPGISMPPKDAGTGTRTPRTRPPGTQRPIIMERYEDELVLDNLSLPESQMEDKDNTPVELLTPEPNFITTAPPKKEGLSVGKIINIVLGSVAGIIGLLSFGVLLYIWYIHRKSGQNQSQQQKQQKPKPRRRR